jgi:flagellar M-ring protein FliF
VLVKERQSQRGGAPGYIDVDAAGAEDPGSTEWEHEYAVGRRTEQSTSRPGAIKRLSVAVALQGAPPQLSEATLQRLVANAVGIDLARGDSIAVMLIEGDSAGVDGVAVERESGSPTATSVNGTSAQSQPPRSMSMTKVVLGVGLLAILLAALMLLLRRAAARRVASRTPPDIDALTARVRQWLQEGADVR